MLKWLENWYSSNCDGDWEHGYGIRIETLDNPVWAVRINLEEILNIFKVWATQKGS